MLITFDLLELDGEADLRSLPLLDRRDAVHWFGSPVPGIQSIEHIETHGEALFREIVRQDQEGIVAKRLDGPYRAGRQPTSRSRTRITRAVAQWSGRSDESRVNLALCDPAKDLIVERVDAERSRSAL